MNGLKRLFSLSPLVQRSLRRDSGTPPREIEELVLGGMSRNEAAQAARREFGNVILIGQDSRRAWQSIELRASSGLAKRRVDKSQRRYKLPDTCQGVLTCHSGMRVGLPRCR